MSRYFLASAAESDLDSIWEYIARGSMDAADRWIEKLFEAFEILAANPAIGHTREDLTAVPVLFWPVGSYLILYRTQPERIEIVAVTQGARDIPSFLEHRKPEGNDS